ncbi:MAG: DUF305 domain-containing protein [Candidatus Competibacteraceae bacterium]|nr:DUF305 domain-containing protein [Candidatus Competibacteraceae bacterium]
MTHLKTSTLLLATLLLGSTSLVQAQTASSHAGHAAPAPEGTSTAEAAPATAAYKAANAKMHEGMAITFTGNADRDFLAGMIPHHQGAIDMAEVVLQYGKDPKVRKLAQNIIKSQKQEITQMEAWLKAMDSKGK